MQRTFVSSSPALEGSNRIIKQESNTNDQHNEQDHEAGIGLPYFYIHKDFICFYSPFFASAFSSSYEELTQSVTVYDTDVEIFGIFNHWIYQQKLLSLTDKSEQLHHLHLSELWVLGQRVFVSSLQNKAMNRIFSLICEVITHKFKEFTPLVYDISVGDNELARIAVCAVACGKPSFFGLFWEGKFRISSCHVDRGNESIESTAEEPS